MAKTSRSAKRAARSRWAAYRNLLWALVDRRRGDWRAAAADLDRPGSG